ncbi:MAG: hypothetical protein IAF02_20915 [Anaerolineae bacterium]|nr:hypothetical protein [Anaerolineae bacterium]
MTTYLEVTQALISAGLLSEADREAAVAILRDRLIVAEAEETKAFAEEDMDYQDKVIADARDLAEIDLEMGQIEDRFIQADVINAATSLKESDMDKIDEADAYIAMAYEEAAAALLAALLIDEANVEATINIITEIWVTTEEDETK